ncbi:unnamed protein product [Cylicocyclus nassatus]|uniref:Uncharacterized protein n=1 Tax=Cylicocyclus nassatus TaxID=53992 RepID=A0AA36M9W7_CYLNA|nr:unnamed protein product [Cylicocyclus nassatus]
MELVPLKCILLAVMAIVVIFFGLLPIKILKVLKNKKGKVERNASFIISLLSCFAGGVFLGVCFLDLMVDAMESFAEWKEMAEMHSDYPFVPLFFMAGFFIVNILEEIVGKFCGHEHGVEERRQHAATVSISGANNDNLADCESKSSCPSSIEEIDDEDTARKVVKSLTFVLALLFHASLEGFAFGVMPTKVSVTTLFCGIIIHKAVVAFSVGTKLTEAHPRKPWVVFGLILLIALITPVGGAIGISVESSDMDELTKNAVSCILVSLSLGTFIHITFFEILVPESLKGFNRFAQWLVTIVGFGIIAGMTTFGHGHSHEHHHHDHDHGYLNVSH